MATNSITQDENESNDHEFMNGIEDIQTLDLSAFGDGLQSHNAGSLEDRMSNDLDLCGLCSEKLVHPRILSCLHVFCERCLDKELMDEGGDSGSVETSVLCPHCHQYTKVGSKKLEALPKDVTTVNVMDVSNVSSLQCTSCTFKENAMSRCCTCHNILCYNCDKAHRFMRCFEHHTVVTLEEMRKDGKKITIHKPLTCEVHPTEHVLFYCDSCDIPVCGECVKSKHNKGLGHHCESILDLEVRVRQELEGMLNESKLKLEQLARLSNEANSRLEDLGNQRSTAKDLINESYQSYKALLEQYKDESLKELRDLYQERELKLMDLTEKIGRNTNMLEDACKFTARLLNNSTIAEIMYLRKTVRNQLANLLNNTPAPDKRGYVIEFKTDFENFKRVLKVIFGLFQTESVGNGSESDLKDSFLSLTSSTNSVISLTPIITNGTLSNDSTVRSPVTNASSLSAPPSATTTPSFEGDLAAGLQNLSLAPAVVRVAATSSSPPTRAGSSVPMSPTVSGLQGYSSIAEYNIAQLATIAENNAAATAVVANVAASPPPSFTTLADLFTTDTAYKNLASLAELGLANSINDNSISNGGILLRSNSSGNLTIANSLINGFSGVSSSTSPIISSTDDMMGNPLNSIVSQQSGAGTSAASGGNGATSPLGSNVPLVSRNNKVSPMQIRCKFGQLGPSKGQFNSPHGFCLGLEEDIIVADTNNHRIQVFEKTGTYKFQFGIPGKDEGQLWYPRKVAVMRSSGKYVVCDRGNERSRMQIFTKNGHFVKKIAIRYIDIVAGLAVTSHGEIVAVDSVSPTVFVISENGDLLRWFDCSDYMREPSDIAIHGKEYYVCDFKGHNVVVFSDEGAFIRRIGCESLTNFPNGIDISDAGDVLIGDSHGNRFHVAVFSRDGSLISEFECPYVKVSRCCGLKITSEGFVVTLAKNNHHVLVLNTLYIL